MRPLSRLPVIRHTRESTRKPPSRGRPGKRLNAATKALARTIAPTSREVMSPEM
jgi:hypothetical protein